ncbi:MAG TPA: hypothetical protein VFR37_06130, partial [Longimicrobium sp.]|nr:hypothetical protein [Longimicrobium sp.]
VALTDVGQSLQEAVGPVLQETGWLGLGSLRSLVDSLGDPRLATTASYAYIPGVHEIPAAPVRDEELRDRIAQVVREYVAASLTAVPLAVAADHARQVLGQEVLDTSWAGYNAFKPLLQSVPDLGMSIVTSIPSTPGYLFIPGVHPWPEPGGLSAPKVKRGIENWIWEGPPSLSPATYAEVFRMLADRLPAVVTDLGQLSRAIYEQLSERGMPTPRGEIVRIVTGLSIAAYPLSAPGPHDPRAIAESFFEFMLHLSQRQQPAPSAEEEVALREQILGGV